MRLHVLFIFIMMISMFAQVMQSENTRLSILRPTSSVTHKWTYLPSGDDVTQQGIKEKQYALVQSPEVTYLQSDFINIGGCDMGMSIRYYVSTTNTHPIKFELVDEFENVVYSFVNDKPQLNMSTMTIGDRADIGILDGVEIARIRVSLSDAYNNNEAIYVDELELYSKNGAGVEYVAREPFNITTNPQWVIIESDNDSSVDIYSLSGTLIKTNAIHSGVNRIDISSGFYLLKIEGKTYKVLVP